MRTIALLLLTFLASGLQAQELQSPSEFLGYELGDRFTRHHRVVDYFEHVASVKGNVLLRQYGETYEHRPLMYAVISSSENMARLDEIRLNNLRRTGLATGYAQDDGMAIVWLSYNIHGNEASSIEAAMQTMYALADESNAETQQWLKNTVVVIDPAINPDGRDRYANFYNQYGNKSFNPNGDDIEHNEPWPGGRPNHYLFDLNRDWAWQTQIESQNRSKIYHEWMPHVHVDFHEQGVNSPYYFAPAAEPLHEVITPWQRQFQTTIGRNHAKYFDKNNWLYFTKERFDLLYPSYGDTYPTYNGAIGMTYEQAGHGYAGLGIITDYGDTLTLRDRIDHHYTTGLSTVEIASKNADKLGNEFKKYFDGNNNSPYGKYKAYIVKNDNADKIAQLTQFLDKHLITYGTLSGSRGLRGFGYRQNKDVSFNASEGDLIISTYQPTSRLVTALFEPATKLTDSLTYDITAWSLPYAYGLDAYAVADRLSAGGTYKPVQQQPTFDKSYAYVAKYNSLADVKLLAGLLKEGVNVRVAQKEFSVNGETFDRGSLVITERNNEHINGGAYTMLKNMAGTYGRDITALKTGFADQGVDIGSSSIARVAIPEIAVLMGPQTSSLNYGEIWHFFEQQIDYPITSISTDYFGRVELEEYDVLVIPHGYYRLFDESTLSDISGWVRDGGKLIVIGGAIHSFKDKSGFGIKEYLSDNDKESKKPNPEELLQSYEEQERDNLRSSIFGAIFKVRLDNTHPLAYGYSREYYTLKTNPMRLSYLENGSNVGVISGKVKAVSGFAGSKAVDKLDDSLVFGVESMGRGQVVYLVDNPLFRGFWENGKLLFSNAVFMVGN